MAALNYNYITTNTHTSNGRSCHQLNTCRKILHKEFNVSQKYIDKSKDKCFCVDCRKARKEDSMVYKRGSGLYIIPEGWTRICLLTDSQLKDARIQSILSEWHPTYHGTTKRNVESIINGDLQFLIPGDTKPNEYQHKIRSDCGRIKSRFPRYNKHTKKREYFDPNCIFSSPSIVYASNYAPNYY